jgi:acylphosphatase
VTNRRDGAVEAVFEGRRDAVDSMVAWCSRGPSGARVDDVQTSWEDPGGEDGFAVR